MARGLITRLEDDFMIIMTDQMTIEKLKPRTDIKIGQRIEYAKKDIYRGFRLFNYKKVSSMLALALVLVLTSIVAFGQTGSREIYAVVSIDINPSVELYLDQSGTVVDYKSFNEDGLKILNKSLLDLNIEDALSQLILQAQDKHYLINRDMILVSSTIIKTDISTNETMSDLAVVNNIKSFMSANKTKYQFVYVEGVQRLENTKANTSLGRETLDNYEKNQSHKSYSTVEALVEAALPNMDMNSEEPIEVITTNGTVTYEFIPEIDLVASVDIPTSNDIVLSTQRSMASRSSVQAKLSSNSNNEDLFIEENRTIKSLPAQASTVAVENNKNIETKEKADSTTPVSNNSSNSNVNNSSSQNNRTDKAQSQTTTKNSNKPSTEVDNNVNEESKTTESLTVTNTKIDKEDNEDNTNKSSEILIVVPQSSQATEKPVTLVTEKPVTLVTEKPVTLVTEKPVTPVTEKPVTPVIEKPVTLVTEKPVAPVIEKPVTPVIEKPVTPVIEKSEISEKSPNPNSIK